MAVDPNVRLAVYNDALILSGERILISLSENREPRRILDSIWDSSLKYCLEQGQWNFAIRASQLDYSPSVEPPFGYIRAFDKPDDWVRTCSVASDPYFNNTIIDYTDEAGYWYCDHDVIYIRYVSNDEDYGNNASAWPETYRAFIAARLAKLASPRFQNGSDAQLIAAEYKDRRSDALTKDALQDPVKRVPPGQFVRSRRGAHGPFRR
ncbi:hypothetical protein [Pantoea cypripedii]|uniref:Tail tubular protein A n=1 Tax=Pantoea cypripedii TaxID=55209 RepID=A0A6B9GBG1_PANCY|nr:hypothetical protein [Pantoea cypripedii]QGY29766.1 hypothetical protein CUN67_12840 [Pantoea cypripedii]